jgi:hypothetical protein
VKFGDFRMGLGFGFLGRESLGNLRRCLLVLVEVAVEEPPSKRRMGFQGLPGQAGVFL